MFIVQFRPVGTYFASDDQEPVKSRVDALQFGSMEEAWENAKIINNTWDLRPGESAWPMGIYDRPNSPLFGEEDWDL